MSNSGELHSINTRLPQGTYDLLEEYREKHGYTTTAMAAREVITVYLRCYYELENLVENKIYNMVKPECLRSHTEIKREGK